MLQVLQVWVLCRTGDGSRRRVVLGEGEAAARQDVLLLQVLEFQDVDLTFDCGRKHKQSEEKKKKKK